MLSLQTVLDRIRQRSWSMAAVEDAVRFWNLPPLDRWHEAEWFMLEMVL
jgi:hypothetical protein